MESGGIQSGFLAVACPKCGGKLRHNPRQIHCHDCDFALWMVIANRRFKARELEELIASGSIGPLEGFRGKTGRPFTAMIKLTPSLRLEFHFGTSQNALTTP